MASYVAFDTSRPASSTSGDTSWHAQQYALSTNRHSVSSYKSDMHVEIQILDKASIRSSW